MNLITLADELTQITPTRSFNLLYIILDSVFLVILCGLLIYKKRYETTLFGLFGGILYLIVDFVGFYLLAHSRSIYIDNNLANEWYTFLVLLWMSLSYGFTNFAFIWLCVSKDKYLKLWLVLIVGWWLICPSIAKLGGEANIITTRTTNEYHGYMGVVLVVSYLILIALMLIKRKQFVNILIVNLIGISVQFGWEFALLINGIRPMNEVSFQTIIINSLMETNLGMPIILLIFYYIRKFFNEDLSKVENKQSDFGIIKVTNTKEEQI